MEKLVTKRITKNKFPSASKKNSRNKNFAKSKIKKENRIWQFISANKMVIIFSILSFVICFGLLIFTFAGSKYFLFLNRPKLFENSSLICILATICLIVNCFLPLFERIIDFYSKLGAKDKPKIKGKEELKLSIVNTFLLTVFSNMEGYDGKE